jgi:predicted DNA-binding mobile mystery protein A
MLVYDPTMRSEDRPAARRQLDQQLDRLRPTARLIAAPANGWIRAIREALGMTAIQLGRRLGVSQQRALAIEGAETQGSLTLASLARAAEALDCQLVYALVPRRPLEGLVEERAAAHARAAGAAQSDAQLVRHLVVHGGSKLWEQS